MRSIFGLVVFLVVLALFIWPQIYAPKVKSSSPAVKQPASPRRETDAEWWARKYPHLPFKPWKPEDMNKPPPARNLQLDLVE
jgi:hypothetical protein